MQMQPHRFGKRVLLAPLALVAALAGGLAVAGSASATASICDSTAGNLVQNCGLESGTTNHWALSGNHIGISTTITNSGSDALFMGTVGTLGNATQTIPGTFAGSMYRLSYYLKNTGSGTDSFKVQVSNVQGGTHTFGSLHNVNAFGWTHYTDTFFTSIGGGSPTITFVDRNEPAYFYLDDVALTFVTPSKVKANAMADPGGLSATIVNADNECLTWKLSGYAPFAPVTVIAYPRVGPNVPAKLGTFDSNGNGKYTLNACLPDTARGAYTLLAAGYAPGGSGVHYQKAETIVAPF